MGVAAGDYNNDGFPDLFISCVGQSRLFEKHGQGYLRGRDATQRPLAGHVGFSSSALWFDYDRDGLLDLFVCNYVKWSPEQNVHCTFDRQAPILLHAGGLPRLDLAGCFAIGRRAGSEDVTAKAGLFDSSSKSLGVTMFDYDPGTDWPEPVCRQRHTAQ